MANFTNIANAYAWTMSEHWEAMPPDKRPLLQTMLYEAFIEGAEVQKRETLYGGDFKHVRSVPDLTKP